MAVFNGCLILKSKFVFSLFLLIQPLESKPAWKTFGDWTLIFRAKSGIGKSVIEDYMTTGGASELDLTLPPGCTSLDGRDECDHHYRHSLIDKWNSIDVQRVKFELYSEGRYVAHIEFDGRNSTSTNWFSQKRVLSSSWVDLSGTSDIFTFFGISNGNISRRLYVHQSWGGCDNDVGWFMAIEKAGTCSYEIYKAYPVFLYNSCSYVRNITSQDFSTADVMAIYIHAMNLPRITQKTSKVSEGLN